MSHVKPEPVMMETLPLQSYPSDDPAFQNHTRLLFNYVFPLKNDPRVDDWLLMDSIWTTIGLSMVYLLIILEIGPRLMKNRPAFELRYPMMAYNLFQALFSFWIFSAGTQYYTMHDHSLICEPVDYSTNPIPMQALRMAWWFYFSKFIDFMDSFFFVLRKKDSQLTLLHIIHHSTMPIFSWMGVKFTGGGNTSFGGTLNMGVHVFMYSYYFLAATGIRKEYLWWKRYLTRLQLIQFGLVILHSLGPFLLSDCNFPKEMSCVFLLNGAMYMVLFSRFYKEAYTQKQQKPKTK
eukprot:TRINITY_DN41784_c0_g1_i1.p1 TRINITY_DN41784_c0_g1~~TRINITY_DN41784_c0_g1_i1.p1  ORF type:complete len:314 (-),score=42.74 TRINITY_DN41784_c0_g1_i1:109-981(-)